MFETGVRQLRMALAMVARPADRSPQRRAARRRRARHAGGVRPPRRRRAAAARRAVRATRRHAARSRSRPSGARRAGSPGGRRTTARCSPRSASMPRRSSSSRCRRSRSRPSATWSRTPPTSSSRACARTSSRGPPARPASRPRCGCRATSWSCGPRWRALSGLLRDEIRPDDCMQVNISSRATAAVQQNVAVCRLVGAARRGRSGIVPADESLDSLLTGGERAPTLLGDLPELPGRAGQGRRRAAASAPTTSGCAASTAAARCSPARWPRAARETLGARRQRHVRDDRGAARSAGAPASTGHLHHDLNIGLVEVIDLDTGEPAPRRRARDGRDHPVLPVPRLHAGVPLRHPRRRAAAPRRSG